jgi:hypothetical protein
MFYIFCIDETNFLPSSFQTPFQFEDDLHCLELVFEEIEFLRNWCLARFWNLDAVLEQLRLDQIRVGKFRNPYKLPPHRVPPHGLQEAQMPLQVRIPG